VVTGDTKEQEFAMKRQLFLTEQGYRYHIEDWVSTPVGAAPANGAGRTPDPPARRPDDARSSTVAKTVNRSRSARDVR
jgi:hypothetical protein